MKWCSAEMEEKGDEAYFVEAKDRQWINNRGLSSMTTGRKKKFTFFCGSELVSYPANKQRPKRSRAILKMRG